MRAQSKIEPQHLSRRACVYVRQSSPGQVYNNRESARRQRDLVKLAASLGWVPSSIVVLDEDQGKSGTSTSGREAFKRMAGEVSVGEVGIVIGLEIARLARNSADFFPLVEMCALTRTLIADEEGIYDPNDPNDSLILDLKGTFSENESRAIRARLHGARWSLARRGELRRKIPTGYVWDEEGRVVFDPDEAVQSAIQLFFRRFEEVGSACGLARKYAREGILFPRRNFRGGWEARVNWAPLSVRDTGRLLHNPFYAGAYFYGERRAVTTLDAETKTRKTVLRHLPLESWEVLIRDAHSAYVSWDQFLRNQKRLKENRVMSAGGPGAARSGAALLQGLVYCGHCGNRMEVRYSGRKRYASYVCARHSRTGESLFCSSVNAKGVDRLAAESILEAIQPLGIEGALEAVEQLEKRSAELRRQWELRIERAEYEAGLARRRYEAVDPANRLVARNLERDWEEGLRAVEELRKEFAQRASAPPIQICPEERDRLKELAQDLPRLWHARTTKSSDRKRVVRILLRDVWLTHEDEPRRTKVRLHWHSGVVTEGYVERGLTAAVRFKTPDVTVARIRELVAQGKSAGSIADELNRKGLRTGRGNSFTAERVLSVLRNRHIGIAGIKSGRREDVAESSDSKERDETKRGKDHNRVH